MVIKSYEGSLRPLPHLLLLSFLHRDLEDLRDEIEDDEYVETRKDTVDQLEEFDGQLKKLTDGDMTLVSELGQMKLALRAAISNAFQTPEVIKSFAAREPTALRTRLVALGQELKLGRLTEARYRTAALEVVFALKRLGEDLSPSEKALLDSASAEARAAFEAATGDGAVGETALAGLSRRN